MAKKIFGAVENGITRKQFDSIVDYVEKMIFDGCGGRKIRSLYLIETGKMFKKGRVNDLNFRTKYFSYKYKNLAPITNIDRIVYNIMNAIKDNNKYPAWMNDEKILRIAINTSARIVEGE